jgi:leader peptidase (prepilin peptidase) / N-methyltransferase
MNRERLVCHKASKTPLLHLGAHAHSVAIAFAGIATSVLVVPGMAGVLGGGLVVIMVAIAAVDARYFIVPDRLILAAIALGLLHAAIVEPNTVIAAMALAAVRGFAVALAFWALLKGYVWLRGREGIGLGDVKLAFVSGIWLDGLAIALAVEVAALAALAMVAVRAWRGDRITRTTPVPFGAFLAPAIWLGWLLNASVLPKPM